MQRKIVMMIAALVVAISIGAYAQKPSLMIFPDKVWCNSKGYVDKIQAQGKTRVKEDYQAAFLDEDLAKVNNVINEIFTGRGFPLVDFMSQEEDDDSEDAAEEMDEDDDMAESGRDFVNENSKKAKADVRLEVGWKINPGPLKYNISYRLSAVDSYSNKKVATVDAESEMFPNSTPMTAALKLCVNSVADEFDAKLVDHFRDLQSKGREGRIRMRVNSSSDINFDSELGDKTLSEVIFDWMNDNTIGQQFTERTASANKLDYDQVRFPMKDSRGANMQMRQFLTGLQKHLSKNYGIEVVLKPGTPGSGSVMIRGSK